jgi:hypothetical protein
MAELDPWKTGSRICLHDDFVSGMRCFRKEDWEGALACFRAADESADITDIYQHRYTSFHGLVRVYMGDRNGVKLCREAAVGERHDAEVFYNLAMAEDRLGFRESACTALRRGLKIDGAHSGLRRLEKQFAFQEKRGLNADKSRQGILGRLFGKLFRGTRKSRSYPLPR